MKGIKRQLTEMLRAGRQSKEHLANMLGTTEREVRRLIAEIAEEQPVIALSEAGSGYRIAKDIEDLEDVRRMRRETVSRMKQLAKRLNALEEIEVKLTGGRIDE